MKLLKAFIFVLPLSIMSVACNESQEEEIEETADNIENEIEGAVSDVKQEYQDYRDETFVENVLEANEEELHLLNLAEMKGSSSIKSAASKMLKDHRQMGESFKSYAQSHNIDYNVRNNQDNLANQEAGNDWDREWIRKMESAHESLINKFERKRDNANDAELRQMVDKNLPVLREHLDMVRRLDENYAGARG